MPKKARLSGIKSYRSYTVDEAADITGVSNRTIRNWAADGLNVMDAERPVLIRGDDLRGYIKKKRDSRKNRTTLDTFYCVCCRTPKKAAGGMADCSIKDKRVTLTALCETCATVLSKPVAEACIPEISRTLDLSIKRYETTL